MSDIDIEKIKHDGAANALRSKINSLTHDLQHKIWSDYSKGRYYSRLGQVVVEAREKLDQIELILGALQVLGEEDQ